MGSICGYFARMYVSAYVYPCFSFLIIPLVCDLRVCRIHSTWYTHTHTPARKCERDIYAHTYAYTHTHTHTHTHASTRSHAHTYAHFFQSQFTEKEGECIKAWTTWGAKENYGVRHLWHKCAYTPVSSTPPPSSSPPPLAVPSMCFLMCAFSRSFATSLKGYFHHV